MRRVQHMWRLQAHGRNRNLDDHESQGRGHPARAVANIVLGDCYTLARRVHRGPAPRGHPGEFVWGACLCLGPAQLLERPPSTEGS